MPTRPSIVVSGKPASAVVGTSVSIEARWDAVTASSLEFPGLHVRPQDRVGRRVMSWMRPSARSVAACTVLR